MCRSSHRVPGDRPQMGSLASKAIRYSDHLMKLDFFSNYEETASRCWLVSLLMSTAVMYGVSITGVVLFYVYYTGAYTGQCKLHEFFISINLVRNEVDEVSK